MKSGLSSRNPSSASAVEEDGGGRPARGRVRRDSCAVGGHAQQAPLSLPYTNSYLTTGNYVSGAIDFPARASVNGS